MYALNLDTDGRVLSVTYPQYASDAPTCDALPVGDLHDYIFSGGKFLHSPISADVKPHIPTLEERTAALEDALAAVLLGGYQNV